VFARLRACHPVVPAPSAPPGREEFVLSDSLDPAEPENPIDPATAALIGRKSRQVLRQTGLPRTDREDVEQTLTLLLLQRLAKFDPHEGDRPAFVRMVLRQATVNVLRFLGAAKRAGRPVSLDECLRTASDEVIRPADREGRPSDEELATRALDVAEALEALPAELRAIAEQLRDSSRTEAAQNLGVSRSTVHERAKEIRAAFERRGLEGYL
jgi:RNA polymerase sigma factor (sigma-70 family)